MDLAKYVARILAEQTRLTNDSVDSQIDSILLGYQDQSSLEGEVAEGVLPEHFRLILEDDEEDKSMGDNDIKSNLPAQPREQKIDVDKFAQLVANLSQNYDNLLNIKPVIVSRAKAILENGYSPDLVDEFLTVLDREFGIVLDGDGEKETEAPDAPIGGVSGPTAGGGV
jgi:hypothetical protein